MSEIAEFDDTPEGGHIFVTLVRKTLSLIFDLS